LPAPVVRHRWEQEKLETSLPKVLLAQGKMLAVGGAEPICPHKSTFGIIWQKELC